MSLKAEPGVNSRNRIVFLIQEIVSFCKNQPMMLKVGENIAKNCRRASRGDWGSFAPRQFAESGSG